MGILSIAALGVVSVLTFGTMTGDQAGDYSEATQLSREIMENIRLDTSLNPFASASVLQATGLTDADTQVSFESRKAIDAAPFAPSTEEGTTPVLPANPRFKRNIVITDADGDPNLDRCVRIQVRVYWMQKGSGLDASDAENVKRAEKMVETVSFLWSGL